MKPSVVVSNWVHPQVIDYLEQHFRVVANRNREQPLSREEIVARGGEAAGLLAFMTDWVDADFLDAMPSLQIVACALKGYDNFDVEACTQRGIWLTIVPDLLTVPTAELTVGHIIALARNTLSGDDYIRGGRFEGWRPLHYGAGLAGSTIGILGMGAVGRAVARRLSGFEATMLYTDKQRLQTAEEQALGLTCADLSEVARRSDYLVLALPLTEESTGLVDARVLGAMKRGSYLINPARGSLVDEEAVADALASGHLAGYAADVFEMEDWARPDRRTTIPSRILEDRERTLLTPHLGSAVDSIRVEIAMAAARSLVQAISGKRPEGAVNAPRASRHAAS